MWVPGPEPGFSGRAVSALNHRAISPAPDVFIFNLCARVCTSMSFYVHFVGAGLSRSQRTLDPLGPGAIGSCEPPDVGAGS